MLTRRSSGFSLIELMVTVSVFAIMVAMALPNFTTWIRNARVRSVADALQSGLRLAQTDAMRRSRTTVFFFTTSNDCQATNSATAGGAFWQIRSVPNPLLTNDVAEVVQCGALNDMSSGVGIASAPTALCFGGDGRLVAAVSPTSIGVDCTAAAARYDVSPSQSGTENRPLRITVSLAGAVRMCDPNKASTAPDGCP